MAEFPYITFDDPARADRVYRPILKLELVNGMNRLPCYGLVDTGADFCSFPMSFAYQLGLNPLNQTPTPTLGAGGGGSAPTYHFDVILDIDGLVRFPVRAGFMDSLDAIGMGLLGHKDFLDRVKAVFDRKRLVFSLEI